MSDIGFPTIQHVSLSVEDIRQKGCTWLVNGVHCREPCAPFLFVCNKHKDIPDIPRQKYHTADSCRKRK